MHSDIRRYKHSFMYTILTYAYMCIKTNKHAYELTYVGLCMSLYLSLYIYIYIYI